MNKKLTDEEKRRFYIYKEVDEPSFPEDRVWKVWIPLPETMPGGVWMQFPTQEEAMGVALLTPAELEQYLEEAWDEGGW